MKNNILSNFQQMSAFKDSPFGQFWEKRLPPWAVETYGPGYVYNKSNFRIIDASKRFSDGSANFYNNLVNENWNDIQFLVFAHPDGNQVLKDYADSKAPKENEVYFFIETNDEKFDFGKIVRVKLGKNAIEKLRFQFPFLNQTNEKELANEFLKRSFEIKQGVDYNFVKAGEEIKNNPEEFKNLLAKAIKYDYQQKKFDDMSWGLKILQGAEYLGLSIPQKLMQLSGEMRAKKYSEEKFWNAELPKDFTPAFLPNAIVPEKRNSIKESILKNVKARIDEITSYGKEAGLLEQVYKEILNNVLLYLFDKFSSALKEGLKILDDIFPEGESLNDLYNLNAFLVGLWNGCIEFAAAIVDLVALIIVIERDGFGYAISDKLTEQLENFFNEAIFGFEDFILKIWKKFNLAIKDFELWYLQYSDNSYYWYKTLGELTPDILTIVVPELAASKAANVSKAGTVVTEVSEEALQKYGKVLSEKLEQTTAKKEVKEAFEKAETRLEDNVPRENKIDEIKIKPKKVIIGNYSRREFDINNCGGPILNLSWKDAKITKGGIQIVKKHLSRFEEIPANKMMIKRLEEIESSKIPITDFDKRFYTHEMREYERYKAIGHKNSLQKDIPEEIYYDTHTATLEDFKIYELDKERNSILYHPSIEKIDFYTIEERKILGL